MKEKLTLPAKAKPNGDRAAPPATPPVTKPSGAALIREFQMMDGRPMALHKSVVQFAAPMQSNPERATIVGIKNAKACPLKIPYADFLKWWLVK